MPPKSSPPQTGFFHRTNQNPPPDALSNLLRVEFCCDFFGCVFWICWLRAVQKSGDDAGGSAPVLIAPNPPEEERTGTDRREAARRRRVAATPPLGGGATGSGW